MWAKSVQTKPTARTAGFISLAAFAAALPLVSAFASTGDLTLIKRLDYQWEEPGWKVSPHRTLQGRDLLVAINKNTLEIESLDAKTGDRVFEDKLDTSIESPQLLQTVNTHTGDFLALVAAGEHTHEIADGKDHRVEFHRGNSRHSWTITADDVPLALGLVEVSPGEVLATVATHRGLEIYKRLPEHEPVFVARANLASPVRQMQTFKGPAGQLIIALLDVTQNVRVLEWDTDHRRLDSRFALHVPGVNQIDTYVLDSGDVIVAEMGDNGVRFYNEAQKAHSAAFPMNPALGESGWLKGMDSIPVFAALVRDDKGTARINLISPLKEKPLIPFNIADTEAFHNLGTINVQGRTLIYGVMQKRERAGGDALMFINATDRSPIMQVTARNDETFMQVQNLPGIGARGEAFPGIAITYRSNKGTRIVVADFRPNPAAARGKSQSRSGQRLRRGYSSSKG